MNRVVRTTALVLLLAAPASAATNVGIRIDIGSAPPPPVIVVRDEPRVVMVPQSRVYVVEDDAYGHDCFQYGVWWYIHRDGWWYRARSWRGPFTVVESRYVPAAVVKVPPRYWRNHPNGGPPGQVKKQRDVIVVKEKDSKGRRGRDR